MYLNEQKMHKSKRFECTKHKNGSLMNKEQKWIFRSVVRLN